jgi:hypothetical protein
MLYFQTKNPDLGKFWRTLELKMLVYFMTVWNIFGNLVGIMYGFGILFPFLVCLGHEKSGRPVSYQLFLFFFCNHFEPFFSLGLSQRPNLTEGPAATRDFRRSIKEERRRSHFFDE